jgi:tRNA-Thr(GGU) m(6)t(6)A37 methyltransferase TsaA
MIFEAKTIGIIRSPFAESKGTPIQPVYAAGTEGTIELFEPFDEGLADLEGFDRIWLLYWCDRAVSPKMRGIPYRDTQERGLFATRAPARPNPIGLSCAKLLRVDKRTLYVAELDVLDGTPLLDLKPYVPLFDSFPAARGGWLNENTTARTTADMRFCGTDVD